MNKHKGLRASGWTVALAAGAMLFGASLAKAGTIVYAIDTTIVSAIPTGNPLQSNTVRGSLTTDGTIGVLAFANILDWNLDLIDNLDATKNYTLTIANSSIPSFSGSSLSATATGLFFDFSSPGEFLIQADDPGPFSGYRYFCFSTGLFACAAGITISPEDVFNDGTVLTVLTGMTPLAPPPATVPEPGSLTVLGLALAVTIFRRRRSGR